MVCFDADIVTCLRPSGATAGRASAYTPSYALGLRPFGATAGQATPSPEKTTNGLKESGFFFAAQAVTRRIFLAPRRGTPSPLKTRRTN